jgi:polyhydroxybutyrate depolymerase
LLYFYRSNNNSNSFSFKNPIVIMLKKVFIAGAAVAILSIIGGLMVVRVNPFKVLEKSIVRVDSLNREFYYHVPDHVNAHPRLIFVIHGSGATPAIMQISTGHEFDQLADESKDAIIVYPAGFNKYWNDCRKSATYDPKKMNLNDVGFFGEMINYFKEHYNIDTTQVFALGHSLGGHICYKLAKEKPQWFRGVAAISASLPVDANDDCYDMHQPVSVLVMNGTSDPINPYAGGEVIVGDGQKRGAVLSTAETIRYWVNDNGCDTLPKVFSFPDTDTSDHSSAVSYLYQNPSTHRQVELVKIINGGHIVPNPGFQLWPKSLGTVNKDIDAPKVIWDFFGQL